MFHTQGLVLKRNFYREFDDVFTVYTKDFGKIEILGRGVKRPLAKLNSHLQAFDFSEVEFVLGKKFKVLTGANLIGNLFSGDESGAAAKAAIDFLNFADGAVVFDDPDNNIWDLIVDFQKFIIENNAIDKNRAIIFSNFYKFRLSVLCGFEPIVDGCALCSRKLKEEKMLFSLKDGGVVCDDCIAVDQKSKISGSFYILPSTMKLFRIFAGKDKDLLLKIKLSKNEIDDLVRVMDYFIKWNIG